MKLFKIITALVISSFLLSGCSDSEGTDGKLFHRISTKASGINFQNEILENDSINILSYEYLYNGGGVGIGDFNKDGLPDVFFSGNQVSSKIYLNEGDLTFRDFTESSFINTTGQWCTGVSIVDINQDGFDDVYLNVGGMGNKSEFPNLLYINNGDLTFTESAQAYGLADKGESIQSLFFDYDLDGDLDMYLLTGGGFEKPANNIRKILKNGQGRNTDRLYRNDFSDEMEHPVFTNVSNEAGINIEGFGLGVSVMDANDDKYPDIYVSNDYLSRDLLYVNQTDGTFREEAENYFGHTSHFSMGNDVADVNNDGLVDLITVDMLPENVHRRKLMSGAHHSHDVFQIALQMGYGHQHMRNMLHMNNGNARFSEIGQYAGIDKTDWSWAPLIADLDNDGLNDLFITNGFGKDITDMDFVKFRENNSSAFGNLKDLKKSVVDCLYHRPRIEVPNYAFQNKGDFEFENTSNKWGFNENSISSGAVYSDLDNDGDLDIIVSNINQPAFVYQNNLREKDSVQSNYLKVKLNATPPNRNGLGAKVSVFHNGDVSVRYNNPVRGFQSSVGNVVHFGLNNLELIDSVRVEWLNGEMNLLKKVIPNQLLNIAQENALSKVEVQKIDVESTYFRSDSTFQFRHKDKIYNDFATQSLLLHKYSSLGPGMAVGDLNNDGLEDVFVGGSYGSQSTIHYQQKDGGFKETGLPETEIYEDGGALIFDADGNGFNDLYITSGGTERYAGHKAYQDRMYYNFDGRLESGDLPEMLTSTASVTGGDYDNDGDIDLFVGGRIVPGKYPTTPASYILKNENGNFVDATSTVCPFLSDAGMVTSAVWTDYNNDLNLDLVLVGEFMPITIFEGNGTKLVAIAEDSSLKNSSGFWNSIVSADFDNDGDIDFVAGNLGLNSNLKINNGQPIQLNYADFDNNGSIDPVFSKYEQGKYYPLATLDQLEKQLPIIKKKFRYYNAFAKASTKNLLDLFKVKDYKTLQASELRTIFIENKGSEGFRLSPLPWEAQLAPINGMIAEDLDTDGDLDLILVGNNYSTEVGMGRYDASTGHVLMNQGKGNFETLNQNTSGFNVVGDSKSMVKVNTTNGPIILVGRNDDDVKSLKLSGNNQKLLKPEHGEVYAEVEFMDGATQKVEFTVGGGYMSQTSKAIYLSSKVTKVTFYDTKGSISRQIDTSTLP